MKTALAIIIALMALPFALLLANLALQPAFGCSGMDHVEHCDVSGGQAIVAFLVGMTWITAPLVPLGVVALVVLGVVWLVRKRRAA